MSKANQTPEQAARDNIDKMLSLAGWRVQDKNKINFNAGLGIAVREYQTDVGPADYALFVDKAAVGVIEAKPESYGHKLTQVEDQSGGYAAAKLKWVNNEQPLPFVYESTGIITRFTNGRDPAPVLVRFLTFLVRKRCRNGCQSLRRYVRGCKPFPHFCTQVYANARLPLLRTWRHRSRVIIPAPSFRWPQGPAKPIRPSHRFIAY